MVKTITRTAGIDTGKDKLDVAVQGGGGPFAVDNTPTGWQSLASRLDEAGVGRVGIVASGRYERGVARHLQAAGFTVVVLHSRCRSVRSPGCTCGAPRATASTPF